MTELALRLGMNKNMVHRALTVLTEEGFLVRNADGRRYQLGHRVLELAGEETDEFELLAREPGHARRPLSLKPGFGMANRQRVLDEQGIDGFDGPA